MVSLLPPAFPLALGLLSGTGLAFPSVSELALLSASAFPLGLVFLLASALLSGLGLGLLWELELASPSVSVLGLLSV